MGWFFQGFLRSISRHYLLVAVSRRERSRTTRHSRHRLDNRLHSHCFFAAARLQTGVDIPDFQRQGLAQTKLHRIGSISSRASVVTPGYTRSLHQISAPDRYVGPCSSVSAPRAGNTALRAPVSGDLCNIRVWSRGTEFLGNGKTCRARPETLNPGAGSGKKIADSGARQIDFSAGSSTIRVD